jgi:hypothetical protein
VDEYTIKLIGGAAGEVATFVLSEVSDQCLLVMTYRGRTIEAVADDFFESLIQLRLQLEKDGLIPFCYGASLNVWPSGMSRQMGGGLKAYRLTEGRQARIADLVDIFDEGPDVTASPVIDQRAFADKWLISLGHSSS